MQCKNHPDIAAADRCAGCAETFCSNCLVDMQGQNYCASCKVMAVSGQPMVEEATIPCKEAGEALKLAIIGLLCCVFLQFVAIPKALKAKKMIEANPRLTGSGQATAALVISVISIVLFVLSMIWNFTVGLQQGGAL